MHYTPPQIAKELGVNNDKVLAWIHAGELSAINVATSPHALKPRYRVSDEALQEFKQRRAVTTHKVPRKKVTCPEQSSPDYRVHLT